jgi:hypothetical protein
MSPEEIDRIARKRAGAKLFFFAHVAVFTVVNLFLFLISDRALGTRMWSPFPLLGWGIGLAFHAISVYVLGAGSSLRERLVEQERERLRRERGGP